MSRYNGNWGSHDQLQELRKANMALHRENDELRGRMKAMHQQILDLLNADLSLDQDLFMDHI